MASEQKIAEEAAHEVIEAKDLHEDLLPTKVRIMDPFSYCCAWLGGNVSIAAFMLGASLVPPAGVLNLYQAFLALLLGLTVTAVVLTLNGAAGHKWGIPFVIQARSCFGTVGLKLPALFRALPGLIWFGVQSWVGASALNVVTTRMFGFDNLIVIFILFQLVHAVIAYTGMGGVKILENCSAIVILLSLAYMLYTIFSNFGAQISDTLMDIPGTWGIGFWGAVTAALGFSTTLVVNISDYMRDVSRRVKTKDTTWLHWIAFVPTNMVLGFIGLLAAGITGYWDPIHLFTEMLPSSFGLIVCLIFIAVAQLTTNLYNNLVPAGYVLVEFTKFSYKKAAVICVFLSFFTFPWGITQSSVFLAFIQLYSAFFGPIFGVMVCEYYIIRRQNYNLQVLYNSAGPFKGVNWQGMVSLGIGAVVGLLEPQLSWFISMVPAFIIYYLLCKYYPLSPQFLVGTKYEVAAPIEADKQPA
ncbi:MAG: NCS1 family transporter [Planctomycetes bacterium]|nr:NCS1 family transporter [Planctomycetota bacterium]